MIHYGPLFGLTRRVPTMAVKNHVRIVFGWLHLYGAALLCGVPKYAHPCALRLWPREICIRHGPSVYWRVCVPAPVSWLVRKD